MGKGIDEIPRITDTGLLIYAACFFSLKILDNSELCKILPGENVSKIIKQFQPLLKDLP